MDINVKEIESLIKLLDDPDTEVSQHVEEKLLSYGSEVVGYLENAWEKSFEGHLQEKIENLVHKIQFETVKRELELWHLGGSFDLLQGMLIINKYQYPDLDEQKVVNQIEALKREIWMQMIYEMSAIEKITIRNKDITQKKNFLHLTKMNFCICKRIKINYTPILLFNNRSFNGITSCYRCCFSWSF